MSLGLGEAHFSAKGAVLAKPWRGCVGICGCSVFLHPAEETHYQKFAACISSERDCDSGLDNVSFSLLCAGSLECQERGAEQLMCLCGALGCSAGARQITQALQHCPGMRKLSLLPREICCIPPTGRTGLPSLLLLLLPAVGQMT